MKKSGQPHAPAVLFTECALMSLWTYGGREKSLFLSRYKFWSFSRWFIMPFHLRILFTVTSTNLFTDRKNILLCRKDGTMLKHVTPRKQWRITNKIAVKQRSSWSQALPGTLVPSATKTMAITASLTPTEHPKCEVTSPMIAVIPPITMMQTKKAAWPLSRAVNNWYKIRAIYHN